MDSENNGNGFNLQETGGTSFFRDNTFRVSLTTIATEHAVNEFRFQVNRRTSGQQAFNNSTAIIVSDAFTSGGGIAQFADRTTDGLEASDDVTYTKGKHNMKFGFRGEANKLSNLDQSNFNGTFLFTSLEQYRQVLLGTPGATPAQFSINRGDPFIGFTQWEYGAYFQDDWKLRNNLTFSYGLRQEFQTHLDDKYNFAPRYSIAWQPAKDKNSTIRGGGGIFYSRLDTGITFNTIRNDGIRQRNVVVAAPTFFPNIPTNIDPSQISNLVSVRVKEDGLNAPYLVLHTVSYERQLNKTMFGSVAYSYTRGVNLLRTININAPLNGVKPFADRGPILEYQSNGESNRQELRLNLRTNFSRTFSMFGGYTYASTKNDTDGAGTAPGNPFDLANEYGRASNDFHHQVFIGGFFSLKYGFRVSPFINYRSGSPFDIRTGRDNNGDSLFTDRPSFATSNTPGAIDTPFGLFNPNPLPGEALIPRNFGDGPQQFTVNLNLSKTFSFGPALGGGFPGMSAAGGNNGQNNNQTAQNNQRQGNRGNNNRGGNNNNNNNNSAMGQAMNQMGAVMMRGGGPGGGGPGGGGFAGGGGGGPMMMRAFGDVRHKYSLTLNVSVNNLLNHTNFPFYNGTLTSPFFGRSNNVENARRVILSMRFGF
jgi:hypothetical protein